MASGRLSPRQKMINMMYLVLTALLALNVSREVMDAFYEVMKGQELTNQSVEAQTDNIYNLVNNAYAQDADRASAQKKSADIVRAEANSLMALIDTMKVDLEKLAGGQDDEGKPKKMSDKEKTANYMLVQQNGKKLKEALSSYRDKLIAESGNNSAISSQLQRQFNTSDVKNKDGVQEPWEKNRFDQYPLISVMTFLTSIQNDVLSAESTVAKFLYDQIGAGEVSFSDVAPMVMPKSTYVTKGGTYEAEVFLAAWDKTTEPEVYIEGVQIDPEQVVNGKGHISLPANTVGTNTWNGIIRLIKDGIPTDHPISGTYNVAPPSVVISPTKMNVLYRGVDNPLEISVPGVDPANVSVSASVVKKRGNGYIADVTTHRGGTVTISVSVKEADGSTRSAGKKEFRVKPIPGAISTLGGTESGSIMSANRMARSKVEAKFDNFDFDLPLTVTRFEIVIPPLAPITCNGDKMSSSAQSALRSARPGTPVIIRNIRARTSRGLAVKVASSNFDLN